MTSKPMDDVVAPTDAALKAVAFAQRAFTKRVRTPEDLGNWKRSRAYYDVVGYINNTSMAIQGRRQGGDFQVTKQMAKLCKIFNWLDRLVYECHPMGVGQGLMRCVGNDKLDAMESTMSLRRKCNNAYKHWAKLVQEKLFAILERQVRPHCTHINEMAQYLTRSFGSHVHFTYGPANELMFVFYLCSLFKSGILNSDDTVAAALLLFQRYLDLVRRLVTFYRLSATYMRDNNMIDDRNILPYIWGCAQLCRGQPFTPPQWDQPAVMETHRQSYMLLSSLEHLQKTMNYASLGVHSYQLWCVLSLSNWPDAYSGLMGAYVKNILHDFYTVQDLIFSEMMSFTRQPLEYILRAYLGDLPKEDADFDGQTEFESLEEEEVEEESSEDTEEEEEDDEKAKKEEEPKKGVSKSKSAMGSFEKLQRELAEAQAKIESKQKRISRVRPKPPVSLYKQPKTEVFLGFRDPRIVNEPADDDYKNLLIRPRPYKDIQTMPPSGSSKQPAKSQDAMSSKTNKSLTEDDQNFDLLVDSDYSNWGNPMKSDSNASAYSER